MFKGRAERKLYSAVLNCRRGWNDMGRVKDFPQIFKIAENQDKITLWNFGNLVLN